MVKSGTILYGVQNIFTVRSGRNRYECRIKGKRLSLETDYYNPLCPGDLIQFDVLDDDQRKGLITGIRPRKNVFSRWNKKRSAPQLIAANIDILVCVCSPDSPPFRPRFIDRVLVICEKEGIAPCICLNKGDFPIPDAVRTRLDTFRDLGYAVLISSATQGTGISDIAAVIRGKTAAFVGQSGVGKSSILNALKPGLGLKTGSVSTKFNRGNHITNHAVLLEWEAETQIIDTPGIREIGMHGIDVAVLSSYFPETRPLTGSCSFDPCTHLHEPGCAVSAAVKSGNIHPDRYDSYRRIAAELEKGGSS
jgi:ribosome biogenesis GTPase